MGDLDGMKADYQNRISHAEKSSGPNETSESSQRNTNIVLTDPALKEACEIWVDRNKPKSQSPRSPIRVIFYISILIIRFIAEWWFVHLELELSKHQSQNADFWEQFWLKDRWHCPVNNEESKKALNHLIPVQNRSSLFWVEEQNGACLQQKTSVTCWIPYSRVKSY